MDTMTTRWGCEGHTENAVCYACAGPDEGPEWWREVPGYGSRYGLKMQCRFVRWLAPKWEIYRRKRTLESVR